MRYHIDTIPVWDAAKIDGECLLCALQRRVELQQIEYSLGASVMEPDVRIQVNKKGFYILWLYCIKTAKKMQEVSRFLHRFYIGIFRSAPPAPSSPHRA